MFASLACACSSDGDGDPTDGGADTDADTDTDGFDPDDLPALDFDAYHTYEEVVQYLEEVADVADGIATFEVAGQSVEGRDLAYLVIDATFEESPPAVLLNGSHHGDEWPATEALLGFVDYALRHLDDPAVAEGLDHFAVYVLPLVNPDGFAAGARENANGVDLNRDYAGPTIEESSAFVEVETQAMKALIDEAAFVAAANYHTGATSVLWPWGYTGNPTDDDADFAAIGEAMAVAMGFDTFLQSYDDYPTEGEFLDYAYFKTGTLALTVEASEIKMPAPAALPDVVAAAVDGALVLLQEARAVDEGGAKNGFRSAPSFGAHHVVRLDADGNKLE